MNFSPQLIETYWKTKFILCNQWLEHLFYAGMDCSKYKYRDNMAVLITTFSQTIFSCLTWSYALALRENSYWYFICLPVSIAKSHKDSVNYEGAESKIVFGFETTIQTNGCVLDAKTLPIQKQKHN